jgi:DinB superfamily
MKKAAIKTMPEYFDRYINLSDDLNYIESLEKSLEEINEWPIADFERIGNKVYAPNKWTIRDIIQHLIDTERIFAYRALCFSRNEPNQVLTYDEDLYASNAKASSRSYTDLIEELIAVRKSSIALFKSFDEEMMQLQGMGFKGYYSVLAIAFMFQGHQRWHLNVINEKYLTL